MPASLTGKVFYLGKQIISDEGWLSFLRKTVSYIRKLVYCRETSYIYEMPLGPDKVNIEYKPKVDCQYKLISDLKELDELIAQNYDARINSFKSKLEKGGMAFSIFRDKKLISITWAAPNAEAKKEIDSLPFTVNFDKGEVCLGAAITDPDYRGKGIFIYTHTCIYTCLTNNGFSKVKYSIDDKNAPSIKAMSRFSPTMLGKVHLLQILGWHNWKYIPLNSN